MTKKIWSCDIDIIAVLPDGSEIRRQYENVLGGNPEVCRDNAIAILYEQLAEEEKEGPVKIAWTKLIFNYKE